MIEDAQRPRYWRHTLLLAAVLVAIVILCAIILPLYAAELNDDTLLGFPLGCYAAAQGVIIILIVAVFWTGHRQARTDREFGAAEEL